MSTQAVVDANDCRTEQQTMGPETADRKSSLSRYSAVKHGLTATLVLPNEDAEALHAKMEGYKASLQTRNMHEDELAERAAQASWRLDRAFRAEVGRLTRNMVAEPEAAALREIKHVMSLGERLFRDRRGPSELYPSRDYDNKQERTSWSKTPDDQDEPALIIQELETTVAGCQFLLRKWALLRGFIDVGVGLRAHQKLWFCRLMGRHPINAIGDPEIAEVFLACHVMSPRHKYAFQELRCEIHEDRFGRVKAALNERTLKAITPPDAKAARAVLLGLIDKATERLRMLEAKRQEVADRLAKLQPLILGFDENKGGEQVRRHTEACNRLLIRNVEAVQRSHRNEAAGWGRTRQERALRKEQTGGWASQGGIASDLVDERLVLDEDGNVRTAEEYQGNLEEGLARYAAAIGRPPDDVMNAPRDIDENDRPRIPDYARWTPPAEEETLKVAGGRKDPMVEPDADFADWAKGGSYDELVTMGLAAEGDRTNIQNLPRTSCAGSVVSGPLSVATLPRPAFADAEANAGVSVDSVASMGLAADGDRTNIQNLPRTSCAGSVVSGPLSVATLPRPAFADAEANAGVSVDSVASMGLAADGDRTNIQNLPRTSCAGSVVSGPLSVATLPRPAFADAEANAGVSVDSVASMGLAADGDRTNIQNLPRTSCAGSVVSGPLSVATLPRPAFADAVANAGVSVDSVASMGLAADGDRTNIQNEIVDVRGAIEQRGTAGSETRAERTICGQGDGGVRDPRRTNCGDGGVRDLRRTDCGDGSGPAVIDGEVEDPRRTGHPGALADSADGFNIAEHDTGATIGLAVEQDRANQQNKMARNGWNEVGRRARGVDERNTKAPSPDRLSEILDQWDPRKPLMKPQMVELEAAISELAEKVRRQKADRSREKTRRKR